MPVHQQITMKNLLNDKSIFRTDLPSAEDVAVSHRDDYVISPEIFTGGLQGWINEILAADQIRELLELSDEERRKLPNPHGHFLLPWTDKSPSSDQLIDTPFVKALLQAATGADFHSWKSWSTVSVSCATSFPPPPLKPATRNLHR